MIKSAAGTAASRKTVTRWTSLGLKPLPTAELIRLIENGLAFRALESLVRASGIEIEILAAVAGIPTRVLARRKTAGKFTAQESDRLVRISIIFEKAVGLFEGDVPGAVSWLVTPRPVLGGESPLNYSRTELGAREVENLIGRLEHGVFS